MKTFATHIRRIALGGVVCLATLSAGAKSTAPELTFTMNLDRGVLPAGASQNAIIKVTLDAPPVPDQAERPPVNLCIVLDRSGSMSGDKIENAKSAAIEALRRLDAKDIFSLVMYDHEVETLVPAQSAANTEWIEGRINSIRSRGNTALYGGVSQGCAEIRKNMDGNYIHRVILLSDGIANVGPSTPSDLGRLGASLMKEGISVTTVGVGMDYNEDLMTKLSQQSDGNTYFVETSDDLPRIFGAELGEVLTVMAKKVILEIAFPEGTRPIRIIGRDGRMGKDKVEIQLNQLYGGQQKFALVEVEVPAGKIDEERLVASARCTYENAVTQSKANAETSVSARFSNEKEEVVKSANREVQADYIFNVIAEAKDDAVDYYDQNEPQRAVESLKKVGEDLKGWGAQSGGLAPEASQSLTELDNEVNELQDKGLDNRKRKDIRTESYQRRNQQMTQ